MKKALLVGLLLALPLGAGAFALFMRGGRDVPHVRTVSALRAEPPAAETPDAIELLPSPTVRQATGALTTTVLWAMKVELELLEARFLPKQEGVPAVGSAAAARISGQIAGNDDNGVAAEVRFVAGANTGRVLRCDADGRFGAADLYPGLSIVEVRGPGIIGSRREVRLRRGQDQTLNIGYGRPGAVFGLVQDASGAGIDGAAVTVDGTQVGTDAEGGFYLQSVAAGQVLCEVEKNGFALYQELVNIQGGAVTTKERMTFTLKPAAELRVVLKGEAGGPGPAQLYLFSDRQEYSANSAFHNESFPWHKLNPIEAWPGRPVTISGLRPEVVKIYAFRAGARAAMKPVNLASNLRDVVIEMQPAPSIHGKVLEDGAPVLGANVRLEAPDRVRATLDAFAEPSFFLETAVMPNLPPSLQEVKSGKDGTFVLSAWADASPVRYLEARGPGGGTWAGRFVQHDEQDVVLELKQVNLGNSTLSLDFPGRFQGLPIEVWIGGAPQTTQVLAAEEPLEIANLVAGLWRLHVTWHAQEVHTEEQLSIQDVTRLEIGLPLECIEGQSEEQWKRAGKEYPHTK